MPRHVPIINMPKLLIGFCAISVAPAFAARSMFRARGYPPKKFSRHKQDRAVGFSKPCPSPSSLLPAWQASEDGSHRTLTVIRARQLTAVQSHVNVEPKFSFNVCLVPALQSVGGD